MSATRKSRLTWRLIAVVFGLVVLSAGPVAAESAVEAAEPGYDNMYPTANYMHWCTDGEIGDGFCLTDNSALTVYRQSSVSSAGKTTIASMLNAQYAPTDLTVTYHSSGTYTGSSETDIIYQVNSSIPSGFDGMAWCDDAESMTQCDQHYVRFRASSVITSGLSCHETGHAVGLTHGDDAYPKLSKTDTRLGCMVTPVGSSVGLGSNNAYWINRTY